jgi:hypothetical protein
MLPLSLPNFFAPHCRMRAIDRDLIRTHGCTDHCSRVKKTLATPEPRPICSTNHAQSRNRRPEMSDYPDGRGLTSFKTAYASVREMWSATTSFFWLERFSVDGCASGQAALWSAGSGSSL